MLGRCCPGRGIRDFIHTGEGAGHVQEESPADPVPRSPVAGREKARSKVSWTADLAQEVHGQLSRGAGLCKELERSKPSRQNKGQEGRAQRKKEDFLCLTCYQATSSVKPEKEVPEAAHNKSTHAKPTNSIRLCFRPPRDLHAPHCPRKSNRGL